VYEDSIVFTKERFIDDCIRAVDEGPAGVGEIVRAAVAEGSHVMTAFGEPRHAGITPVYVARNLTIINFVWAPCMSLMPHNHQMTSVVGIYSGREDNIFWQRTATSIAAVGAKSLGPGEVALLNREIIHSVLNPIGKMSCAIHVYGGNFFEPEAPRSEWDHETLVERPWNIENVRSLFREAEMRYGAAGSAAKT